MLKIGQAFPVERDAVNDERRKCPHFFRVPTPVAPPWYIGPDSSDKDAYGEQEYGRVKNQPADSL